MSINHFLERLQKNALVKIKFSSNTSPVNASWIVSSSGDSASQVLNIYQSGSCTGAAIETSASLANNINTYSFGAAVSNNSYTYTITTTDNAGNTATSGCSSSIYIDTVAPADATGLGWAQTSPFSGTTVAASWTPSVDADLASQLVQFYSDGTCTTPQGSALTVAAATNTQSLAGVSNGNTYSYIITSTDTAGNSDVTACSGTITIDTAAPTGATAIAWTQTSPHNTLSVDATWTPSSDGDEASQTINFYENDATCTAGVFATSSLTTAVATYNFTTGSTGNKYYYTITTTDQATNAHVTACSAVMELDTIAPAAANTLAWTQSSPSNATSMDATWIVGGSADAASQSVQLYADATCSTASGAPISIGSGVTTTNFTGSDGSTYSFIVTTTDSASNTIASACSGGLTIDTTAPVAPTPTNWAQGTIHNATVVTSRWALGGSPDLASHRISYFTDSGCSSSAGPAVTKTSTDTDDVFIGANGNTYFYTVVAIDNAGNESTPACNTIGVEIDTTTPPDATGLGWTQGSPFNGATVDSAWSRSLASDIASQSIQYYADGSCTTNDGPAITLGAAAVTHNRSSSDGATYTYKITTIDNATNSTTSSCSSAMEIDSSAPIGANTLAWTQSSPTNTTNLNTTWVASTSPDIASQTIEYFSDACTTSVTSVTLAAGVTTHNFTSGTNGNTYYFQVTSTDTGGNATPSLCSVASITIDTDFPTAANTIAWSETSPSNSTAITATWVNGGAGDIANHRVDFYNDGTCSGSVASSNTESAIALSSSFSGTNATTHSYKVVTIDTAGNEAPSICSNAIIIDTAAPTDATLLAWTEGTSSNTSPVEASWTVSGSTDKVSQEINIYQSATCTGAASVTATLATNIATFSFAGAVSNNSYAYTISTTDNAGNIGTTACSASIYIDINPPSNPTLMGWVQSNPYNGTDIDASWTPSSSADLASQTIQFYADGTCLTPLGSTVSVSSATNTLTLSGVTNNNLYSYSIVSFDTAGNSTSSACSSSLGIDTQAPTGATLISWVEGIYDTDLSVNATWTSSSDGDETNEIIKFYENSADCSGAVFQSVTLPANTGTYNFTTGSSDNDYRFTVTTTDGANDHVTTCSAAIRLDTSAPAPQTALAWSQISPHDATTVEASWAPSVSTDVLTQEIQFYDDGVCGAGNELGAKITGLGSGVTTQTLTGTDGITYSYVLTTNDNAGNSTDSSCSSSMEIDTTDPLSPTGLGWFETSPHDSLSVTSQWTLSSSGDVVTQRIDYYIVAGCGGGASSTTTVASGATSNIFSGSSGNTYYYTVTAIDNAGNETTSACIASGMLIDTSAPAAASNLSWSESNPTNETTLDPTWTLSGATDIDTQTIEYFTDVSCSATTGVINTLTNTDVTDAFTATVHNTTYYFKVTTIDTAGNTTASNCSTGLTVDYVNPDPPTSAVVASAWVNGVAPLSLPSFSWTNPVTTFNKMEVALGTSSGGEQLSNWSSVGAGTSTIFNSITPASECAIMYPSVKTLDTAGNESSILTLPTGVRWDNTAPSAPTALNIPNDDATTTDSATLTWTSSTDNCEFAYYEIAVSTSTSDADVVSGGDWQNIGDVNSYQITGLSLAIDTNYFILLKAFDSAGNPSLQVESAPFQNNSAPYALLKGAETTASGADRFNFNNMTEESIKWSLSSKIDGGYFEHSTATNAHQLTIKVAGDYYISYNTPVESPSVGGGQRVVLANDLYINGVLRDDFRTNNAYIRYLDDQEQSSNAMGAFVTLAANDVITLTTKGTNVTGNIVSNNATLYAEYIKPGRTIFKATTTQNTAGTNYNTAAQTALEWSSEISDTGFTHSNAVNPENIRLDNIGTYKLSFNLPYHTTGGCPGSSQRTLVRVRARLDGADITSAVGANGYIRCQSNFKRSSTSWTGYIKTTAPNQILTLTTQRGTLSGDPLYALVDTTTREGSISVELVDSSSDTIILYGDRLVSGVNWASSTTESPVQWSTQDELDATVFSHSTAANNHEISVDEDGDYQFDFSVRLTRDNTLVSSSRSNVVVKVQVNGLDVSGGECSSLYARNQNSGAETHEHLESSCSLEMTLPNLSSGDVITFTAHRETVAAAGDPDRLAPEDAQLVITKKR